MNCGALFLVIYELELEATMQYLHMGREFMFSLYELVHPFMMLKLRLSWSIRNFSSLFMSLIISFLSLGLSILSPFPHFGSFAVLQALGWNCMCYFVVLKKIVI